MAVWQGQLMQASGPRMDIGQGQLMLIMLASGAGWPWARAADAHVAGFGARNVHGPAAADAPVAVFGARGARAADAHHARFGCGMAMGRGS